MEDKFDEIKASAKEWATERNSILKKVKTADKQWTTERDSIIGEQSNIKKEMQRMKETLHRILTDNQCLKQDNEYLKQDNDFLKQDNRLLQQKVEELDNHLVNKKNLNLFDIKQPRYETYLKDSSEQLDIENNKQNNISFQDNPDIEEEENQLDKLEPYSTRRDKINLKMKQIFQQLLADNKSLKLEMKTLNQKIEDVYNQQFANDENLSLRKDSIKKNSSRAYQDPHKRNTPQRYLLQSLVNPKMHTEKEKSTLTAPTLEDDSQTVTTTERMATSNEANIHLSTEDDSVLLGNNFKNRGEVTHCGIKFEKKTLKVLKLYILLGAVLLIGGGIFNAIEKPGEDVRLIQEADKYYFHKQQIIDILHNHNASKNITETTDIYEKLQEHAQGFDSEPIEQNHWNFFSSTFFVFSIITTIGNGKFTPMTKGGRLFVVFYSLIGIPITALSLTGIAERVLYFFNWVSKVGKDKSADAFQHFDKDGTGTLEKDEFKSAVKELGFNLTSGEMENLWAVVDKDASDKVDLEEFRYAVEIMDADTTSAAGHKNKLLVVTLIIIFWLSFGVIFYTLVEKWSPDEALYFLFVSLATIGLGDLTPSTDLGLIILFAYLLFGLGLLSIFIAIIQEMLSKVEDQAMILINRQKEFHQNVQQLKQLAIFECLSAHEVKELARHAETFEPFKPIITEGSKLNSVYVLLDGHVIVSHTNSEGTGTVVAPSLLFDPTILEDLKPLADATVSSTEKVKILTIPQNLWESLVMNAKSKNIDMDSVQRNYAV